MKFEELTIKQIVDTCYNTKYCNDCVLHDWCQRYLEQPPTDWEVHAYTKYPIPIEVKEVEDDQRA